MAAPFAAIESATAAAAVAALANVTATIGAVAGVEGIFDNVYADSFGVAGSSPSLLFVSSAAPSAAHGTSVVVGGISYTVTAVQPDGTGMTRLMLQEA